MRSSLKALLLSLITLLLFSVSGFAAGVDDMQPHLFTDSATGKTLPYRIFIPANYDATKTYPLILFLHGAGERGTDNRAQVANGVSLGFIQPEVQAAHPCFFVAPQCPVGKQWVDTGWGQGSYSTAKVPMSENLTLALAMVRSLQKEYSIDRTRMYVTGLSMGGYGTWDLIERNPGMFAAAIAICGAGDPSAAGRLKGMGLWAFHAADDNVVPVTGSRDMTRALWAAGLAPNYTEYTSGGHSSWFRAYATLGLVDWLFSFHRDAAKTSTP